MCIFAKDIYYCGHSIISFPTTRAHVCRAARNAAVPGVCPNNPNPDISNTVQTYDNRHENALCDQPGCLKLWTADLQRRYDELEQRYKTYAVRFFNVPWHYRNDARLDIHDSRLVNQVFGPQPPNIDQGQTGTRGEFVYLLERGLRALLDARVAYCAKQPGQVAAELRVAKGCAIPFAAKLARLMFAVMSVERQRLNDYRPRKGRFVLLLCMAVRAEAAVRWVYSLPDTKNDLENDGLLKECVDEIFGTTRLGMYMRNLSAIKVGRLAGLDVCTCGREFKEGVRITCRNKACGTPNQSYHLRCVGRKRAPAKTAKWFCMQCRGL